ncbi:MAG TPA: GNAT family N-acetyltransferase [Anaerolineae bacterium]
MKLTRHNTADQFLGVTRDWLLCEEAANNLMLGIALRLKRSSVPCYLATVSDADGLALAALHTPPFPITLVSPSQAPDEALALLARDLLELGAPIVAASGRAHLAECFAALWSRLKNVQYHVQMNMRVYELHEVTPPPVRTGHFRIAEERDVPILTEWMRAFLNEALHGQDTDSAGPMTQRRVSDGELFVWEVEDQPVSMAASTRPLITGITVNMVYTPPALRGKGYASVCVAGLSQHLLNEGWGYCTLFTDLDNPTSNSIYQKIGYRPVCDFVQVAFDSK